MHLKMSFTKWGQFFTSQRVNSLRPSDAYMRQYIPTYHHSFITWFCYQSIAKPGNKTAAVSWPDPYTCDISRYTVGYFENVRLKETLTKTKFSDSSAPADSLLPQADQYFHSNRDHVWRMYEPILIWTSLPLSCNLVPSNCVGMAAYCYREWTIA